MTCYWPFVRGIHQSPAPFTKSSGAQLWCFLGSNSSANNWDTSHLRCHCAQYGVTVVLLVKVNGPLARYVKFRLRMRRECQERFPRPRRLAIPTCIYACWVSLTSGFLWSRWRGKHSQHSQRMHNPKFYVSGKRPMVHFSWSRSLRYHCIHYSDVKWVSCCLKSLSTRLFVQQFA